MKSTRKFLENRGAITVEASLVFVVFVLGYLIINSISINLTVQSLTRKALFETANEVSYYIQLADTFFSKSDLETDEFDINQYKELIKKEIASGMDIEKLLNQLIEIAKGDLQNISKKNTFLGIIKNIFLKNITKLNVKYNIANAHIKGGINGLKFNESKLLENGNNIEINLKYKYIIGKFGLLNFEDDIEQVASLDTWVTNISKNKKNSIWTASNFVRGRYFANKIREEKDSIDVGFGFDFIEDGKILKVISVNIFNNSYSNENSIIEGFFNLLENENKKMLEQYEKTNIVRMQNGKEIKIKEYTPRLFLILPEEALKGTDISKYIERISKYGEITFLEKAFVD